MIVHNYEMVQEKLYQRTLSNGLNVFLMPKSGFTKTFMTFSAKFGSIDTHFRAADGREHVVPDGIAHFLEHKMFAKPEGDVFNEFAQQGASANAFTSFDCTTYLFSCSDHLQANVNTLLNFVQQPYFVPDNIEKEKGIIEQEILMYQDNPDWRLYFGLLNAMFQQHPLRVDIAGSVSSIKQIDADSLYACYHQFYHPQNMCVFVVGGFEPEQMMQWIEDNQASKTFVPMEPCTRLFPHEPAEPLMPRNDIRIEVSQPKLTFGFKQVHPVSEGDDMLERESALSIYFQSLFSASSPVYQRLYSEQLITTDFSFSVETYPEFTFSMIGGDTPDPDRLLTLVRELIQSHTLDESTFQRIKKKSLGLFIRTFNSPSAIANSFTGYYFHHSDFMNIYNVQRNISLETVMRHVNEHVNWDRLVTAVVRSHDDVS